jgi:hypothetical protein
MRLRRKNCYSLRSNEIRRCWLARWRIAAANLRSCLRSMIPQSPDRKLLIALFRWSRHSLSPQSSSLPDIDLIVQDLIVQDLIVQVSRDHCEATLAIVASFLLEPAHPHVRRLAYREQYFEDAVECSGARHTMPSPSPEKSHGIDPDYRCSRSPVRRRRILGSQSRSLVMN